MNNSASSPAKLSVSFVIPVFNPGEFLAEAVNSIKANLFNSLDIEILLVDDCSTAFETLSFLDRISQEENVVVIRQPQNGGPAKARNAGIRAATKDWIAFLDADDLLAPGTMLLRQAILQELPHIQWIAGDMLEMPVRNTLVHTNLYESMTRDVPEVLAGVFMHKLPTRTLVNHFPPLFGSMMVRRELFELTGLLDDSLTYGEDYLFCWTASCHADLYWIKTPCLYLRRHHESLTKDRVRAAKEAFKADLAALKDPRFHSVRKELRWHISGVLRDACQTFLSHRQPLNALKSGLHAFRWTPNDPRTLKLIVKSLKKLVGLSMDAQ